MAECFFQDTRSAYECWACPNIKCGRMERPYTNMEHTMEVAERAARILLNGRIRGIGDDYFLESDTATELFKDGLAAVPQIRLTQAREAWVLGLATQVEAAKYVHVRVERITNDIFGSKAREEAEDGAEG